MFANFIYLIVALLTVSFYQPVERLPFAPVVVLSAFVSLTLLFAAFTCIRFKNIERISQWEDRARLDHRFSLLLTRHTILALILFAIHIWVLHLPTYLEPIHLLSLVPTLKALLFLSLFIGYQALIWWCAFGAHQKIYGTDISRKNYVYSNIAFSVPILIPWTFLFGITDILNLLPFEPLGRIFDTPAGQIVFFIVFLFITAIIAPVLLQYFWRCRPLANGPMRNRIDALCRKSGVGYANIVHWPIFGGRMITAGVMGLVSRFRYIMVTDALLQLLTDDQIDQVIAHEIGHVKHKHLQLYLIFFIGIMLISYTMLPLSYYLVYFSNPPLGLISAMGIGIETVANLFYFLLLVIGIVVYFRYLFGFFMRNFERQADTYVFELFPTAQPLIDTFGIIVTSSGQPANKPNWHHFSIQQRMDFLRLCEHSSTWIKQHNLKVKKSLVAVLVGFLLLGAVAFQFNQMVFGAQDRRINIQEIERYLDHKQKKTAKDGLLYWMVGNFYYAEQDTQRAAAAYEASLALHPDNADALNNLAWLLCVDDSAELHDPQRALQLSKRAIALKKAPHIWDTLAQAFYANGRLDDAIAAEEQALAMNPEDRIIYESQLLKFKKALEKQ